MKTLYILLLLAFSLNANSASLIDFDFNELANCQGQFGYEKVFLFAGRGPTEVLLKDQAATQFIGTVDFGGKILRPVSEAYSIELFKNYTSYESLKENVDRLAVVLVEREGIVGGDERDYALILVVTEGKIKGTVLAAHSANLDVTKKILESDRFTCTVP